MLDANKSGMRGPKFWDFLFELQQSSALCDVQLCVKNESNETLIYPAHKLVLAASSKYFHSCLVSDSFLDVYNFDGISSEQLEHVVDYMYRQLPWQQLIADPEAAQLVNTLEIYNHDWEHTALTKGNPPVAIPDGVIQQQGGTVSFRAHQIPKPPPEPVMLPRPVVKAPKKQTDGRVVISQEQYESVLERIKQENRERRHVQRAREKENVLQKAIRIDIETRAEARTKAKSEESVPQFGSHSDASVAPVEHDARTLQIQQLVTPVSPDAPQTSAITETPDTPETPDAPETHVEPETYEDPETRVEPETHVEPETRVELENPDSLNTEIPDTTGNAAAVTGTSFQPETPSVSVASVKQDESSAIIDIQKQGEAAVIVHTRDVTEQEFQDPAAKKRKLNPEDVETPSSDAVFTTQESTSVSIVESHDESSTNEKPEQGGVSVILKEEVSCEAVSPQKTVLYTESEDGLYNCSMCDMSSAIEEKMRRHTKVCKISANRCSHCRFSCFTKQGLRKHMQRAHGMPDSSAKPVVYECDTCQQVFTSQNELFSHVKSAHAEKPFICDLCDSRFLSTAGLLHHVTVAHAIESHTCDECGKCFRAEAYLRNHMRNTHRAEGAGLECEVCHKQFKLYTSLKRHLRTFHSNERPFQCEVCPSRFKAKEDMKRHLKLHFDSSTRFSETGQRVPRHPAGEDYPCGVCGKVFKNFYHRKAHEGLQHLDKQAGVSYLCTRCNKSYSTRHYLNMHVNNVHKPKRVSCEKCHRSYQFKYELLRHMPKCKGYPEGPKPFVCNTCGTQFTMKGNLTKHQQRGTCKRSKPEINGDIVVVVEQEEGGQLEIPFNQLQQLGIEEEVLVCDELYMNQEAQPTSTQGQEGGDDIVYEAEYSLTDSNDASSTAQYSVSNHPGLKPTPDGNDLIINIPQTIQYSASNIATTSTHREEGNVEFVQRSEDQNNDTVVVYTYGEDNENGKFFVTSQ